jgi:hypothetical protein
MIAGCVVGSAWDMMGGRMATPDRITARALNRAMLDRQLLLRRHPMRPEAAIGHLLGLQAQVPKDPYTGLWSRLHGFHPDKLSALLLERRVVRTTLMRSTIHLVTAADAVDLRRLMQPVILRMNRDSVFGRRLDGVDLDAVAAAGRAAVDERPRTAHELGMVLAERWPDRDRPALANAARTLVPMVQITPRGTWGASHQPTWAALDTWLADGADGADGDEGDRTASVTGTGLTLDGMVLRYLAGFGPATVRDVQAWSGLTRLAEVVDRLRPQLRTFRTTEGRELFDLPDARRPHEDTPAPVRYLPEYDNLGLGLADRSRFVVDVRPLPSMVGTGLSWGTVLVDGCFGGMWRIADEDGRAVLTIAPTSRYSRRQRADLVDEGLRLLGLHAAGVDPSRHDVRIAPLDEALSSRRV